MAWTHKTVWGAIDALAARHDLTPSGLAKKAGLDATAFNPSKRLAPDGRPRWPSTESIAKVLDSTQTNLDEFLALVRRPPAMVEAMFPRASRVPLIGMAQAGSGGFFDDGGFPAGQGWGEIELPSIRDEGAYALQISGDSMMPLYRDGDVIVVSPSAQIRKGDRVVVKTKTGEVTAKILVRQTTETVELHALNPAHENRTFKFSELEWIARIVWASQ